MEGAPSVTLSEGAAGPAVEGSGQKPQTLASALAGKPAAFVNADVMLDSEPVIGSFTVDGLTYAVIDGPYVELVNVPPMTATSEGDAGAVASGLPDQANDPADPAALSGVAEGGEAEGPNEDHASEAGVAKLALPETISYEGVSHIVSSVGAYAFYLSGVTDVVLPASVSDVDDRAFRSSDVASVGIAEGNPFYASYDGVLYDATSTSLLLIPGGRQGAVRISSKAEEVDASAFSHCAGVDAISVDADSAHLSSWEGLLYDADGTTLLRVPAGATEVTIREGCTTIAAGALEACANLERINAPASVISISPDVFTSVPTVSLPAAALAENAPQLTAMVALSSNDDCLPEASPSAIEVLLVESAGSDLWGDLGFRLVQEDTEVSIQTSDTMRAKTRHDLYIYFSGTLYINQSNTWAHVATYTSSPVRLTNVTQVDANAYAYRVTCDQFTLGYFCKQPSDIIQGQWSPRVLCGMAPILGNHGMDHCCAIGLNVAPSSVNLCELCNRTLTYNPNEGAWGGTSETRTITYSTITPSTKALEAPTRHGFEFKGWGDKSGSILIQPGDAINTSVLNTLKSKDALTLYAQWKSLDRDIGFDTSAEPGDKDYPGVEKPDQTVTAGQIGAGDKVEIEDPKRPGYVFQGWTIPNAEGTEAIYQDLVYQDETDGKWYVDASKLPDYAGDDGRVELTARWTSVISVDVPSSVTFYADVVTQGNESREGLASSAFGQSKVASQSEVDLRIVGLESKQVKGNGSTSLGASDILKKKDGSALPTTSDKLFSLYPATGELTEDDLKDPDATSASKPEGAVDFSLDDILLEKSFAADKFTIPAGDTLSLGYRLNLQETSTALDYDKLSILSEGTSASIASISYCFAADALPSDWGEPLWVENPDRSANPAKYLLLRDIKEAADDLSANGVSSAYYGLYKNLLDGQAINDGNFGASPYFQLKVDGVYLPLQLIGICQDTKTAGGKAGLTFQMRDIYALNNMRSDAAGGGALNYTHMNSSGTNLGGWSSSAMRTTLRSVFWSYLPSEMQAAIVGVDKHQQLPSGATASYLQKARGETIWLPSMYEIFGTAFVSYNEAEALTGVSGYTPFQYQAYQGNGGSTTNVKAVKTYDGLPKPWWLRSTIQYDTIRFCLVYSNGYRNEYSASNTFGISPCFAL